MKIAVINQPLANRGDEAAHKAFMRSLTKSLPNWKFDVIFLHAHQNLIDAIKIDGAGYINLNGFSKGCTRIAQATLTLNMISFACFYPIFRKLRRTLKEYDAVICAPGGICMGGFMDWLHVFELLLADKLGKPIFYWGRSIGPFSDEDWKHKIFKRCSEKVLRASSFISLRDSVSKKICNNMGFECVEVVDSAFLEVPTARIPEDISSIIGGNYVVFVPNELTWHFKYRNVSPNKIDEFHLALIELLMKKYPNHKIVMLPQTYSSSINDYTYFKKLGCLAQNKNVLVLGEDVNSDVQQKIIAGASLVVGERYHSIVFAINNKVPFVALSYEHKIIGLLDKLGIADCAIEIQNVFDSNDGLNSALQRFSNLLEHPIKSKAKIDPHAFVQSGLSQMIESMSSMNFK